MGDTPRDLYADAPQGAKAVDFEDLYADAPVGAVPVEFSGTDEPLKGLTDALRDAPEGEAHKYNALAALVLAQETGVDPGKIYQAIDLYNELDSGTKQAPKSFFTRVWDRLKGGYVAQALVVPGLKHMFGDRTPERWAQIKSMMQQLPPADQFFAALPKPTQERRRQDAKALHYEELGQRFPQPATSFLRPEYVEKIYGGEKPTQPGEQIAQVERERMQRAWEENPIWVKTDTVRLILDELGLRHDPMALQFILEAANILPQLSVGLASNLVGMGIGGAAGYAVAGPPGAAKGAAIGGKTLGYLQMALAEAIPDYIDMVENGIDPNIATPVALASGIMKAPIEFMQVSELFSPLLKGVFGKEAMDFLTSPVYKQAARAATKRATRTIAQRALVQGLKTAKGFGPGLMKEAVWEEGAQGAIGFVMKEFAIELNNATRGTAYEHNWQRFGPEITDTITRAVMGFAPLQLLTSTAGGVRAGAAAAQLGREGGKAEVAQVAETPPAQAPRGIEAIRPIPAHLKEAAVAAMKSPPAPEKAAPVATPEQTAAETGSILALRTKDGKIHADPAATDFLEVAEHLNLDPGQIEESGRIVRGRYLDEGEYEAWQQAGAKREDLPESDASQRMFHAIKQAKPDMNDDTAYAIVAMEEARARSRGLTMEEDLTRYYQREIVTTEAPQEGALMQPDPETQKRATELAVKSFGLTRDPREAGFILADGSMLDFSGRKEAKGILALAVEQMPEYVQGGRHIDHRDIGRVFTVSPERGGKYAGMADFMAASGAVRFDADTTTNGRSGSASIYGEPNDTQLQAMVDGWQQARVERVTVSVIDQDGNDKASVEIPWPTVEKLKRFIAEARYAGTRAALYQEAPTPEWISHSQEKIQRKESISGRELEEHQRVLEALEIIVPKQEQQQFVGREAKRIEENRVLLEMLKDERSRAVAIVFESADRSKFSILAPAARGSAPWQLSVFDPSGPVGSIPFDSHLQALKEAIREGYKIAETQELPGETVLYQGTKDWLLRSEEIIRAKMKGPMPGSQVRAMLLNNGVKADEMKWIGLDTFLRGDERKTPEEVLRFIAENRIEIQEIQKFVGFWDEMAGAEGEETPDLPRYNRPDLNLPGGLNYRELLLTLPRPIPREPTFEEWYEKTHTQPLNRWANDPKMMDSFRRQYETEKGRMPEEGDFRSGHWREPNVLVHIRFNERTDAQGRRVLFIEEIQSDWHEIGRREGYRPGPDEFTADRVSGTAGRFLWTIRYKGGDLVGQFYGDTADEAIQRAIERGSPSRRVPPAPFSKTWHELAFKRMLRWAVENRFDAVAWTTGEQQAERYDLSKQLETLYYDKNKDGTFDVTARTVKGENVDVVKGVTPEKLADYVGKDLAKKISEGAGEDAGAGAKALRGVDLQVGGEGMKGFYDKILVDFANKYGKKWGAAVQDTEVDAQTVHALPVTPEMAASVRTGQYMFQKGKAAVSFDRDGKALIHACQATDFSSFVHEMGHIWRRQLDARDLATLERWLGIKDHQWSKEHEETFANGLEQYVKENVIPNPVLKSLFDKFKEWLKTIYDRFAQFLMPEDVKEVYEGLFLTPEERRVRRVLRPGTKEDFGAIMGALETTVLGGDIRGLGLNRAEMTALYSRYGVKRAIPTVSESATGTQIITGSGAGSINKTLGKEGDYLWRQYQANPVRWRRIAAEAQMPLMGKEDMAEVEEIRKIETSWGERKKDIDAVVRDVLGLGEEKIKERSEGAHYLYDETYTGKQPEGLPDGRLRIGPKFFAYSKAQQVRLLRDALTSARREARMAVRLAEQEERALGKAKMAEHKQREKVGQRIAALRQIKADIDANKLKIAPEYLRPVREILAGIDLQTMKKGYRDYLAELQSYLKANPNTELSEDTMDQLGRLEEKNIRDMAANEVEALYQTIKHYLHLAADEKFINFETKKRDFAQVKSRAISQLPVLKDLGGSIVTSENKAPDLIKAGLDDAYQTFVGIEHDHYDLIVEKVSGKNSVIDHLWGRAMEDSRSKALEYHQRLVKKIQDTLDELRLKNPVEFWNTRETYGQLELSRMERAALYLHSLNEDNWDSISLGGLGFRGKRGQGNRVYREGQDFLQGTLREHLEHMSTEEKVLCETVRELHEIMGKDQGDVFLRVNGYEMPLVENHYFKDVMPIGRGSDIEKQEILEKRQKQWVRVGVPKGRLKPRKGVTVPLYLNDIFYDLQRDISEAATYIAFEEPLRAASKLLYDRDFREQFEKRASKRAWRKIEEGLKDVVSEMPAFNEFDKLLNKLRRNTTTAYVALGFPILKQGLTMFFGGAYVREDYLMRGLGETVMHRSRVFDLHRLYSPKFVERGQSTGWRDIAEIQRATLARRLAGGKDIRMLAMKPTRWMDMGVTSAIMQGAVLQVLDEFKKGHLSEQVARALSMRDEQIVFRTADEKMALAYKYADYAIARLQDVAFPEHRSPWQRGGQLQRMTSTFGTSTNQIWNLLKRSALEAQRYGTSASYKKLARVILAVFASALGEAAIDTLRDRLKKREPRKYDFLWKALNSIAGNWLIIRDLWNAIQQRLRYGWGGDVSLGPLSVLNRGVDVAVDIRDTCRPGRQQRKAAWRLTNDVIDLGMILSGLPFYAPKKLLQGVLEKTGVLP